MDLRSYYTKVREAEATLTGDSVVVVSLVTSEGGKEGVRTEAPRKVAAKLIAEARARVATQDEAEEFRAAIRDAKARIDREEAAKRMHVMVIPSHDLRQPKEEN
jgi:hypothetical protein